MELAFEPVFNLRVPRRGPVGLRPEILDRIGASEFKWNQMIDFVVASSMICDAVLAVNLLPNYLRNIAHLFGYPGTQRSWAVTSNALPGVSVGSGTIGVGCWPKTTWAIKNKKTKARMYIG
jgi:hypothetical protein